MKLILFVLFCFTHFDCKGDNPYDDMINFIYADSVFINKRFEPYSSTTKYMCISNERITHRTHVFMRPLLDYYESEFNISKDSAKSLYDNFINYQSMENDSTSIFEIDDISSYNDSCELIIFFSELVNNQCRAMIEIYCEECDSYRNYHKVPMPAMIEYLFILENDIVIKVFKEIAAR